MTQDLKSISVEAFQLQLYKIGSKELVKMVGDVQQMLAEYGKHMSHQEQLDMLRKVTKIQSELTRRKYITKQNKDEFERLRQKTNFKKRFW